MPKITYELDCDACGSEWSITEFADDDINPQMPIYCPFCGVDLDLSDIEEEDEREIDSDYYAEELDFDDED